MIEKELRSVSGYLLFIIGLVFLFGGVIYISQSGAILSGIIISFIGLVILIGLTVINPNEAVVTTFFGD